MPIVAQYQYLDVVYMVQRRTNEPSFPGSDIILFANRGLELVVAEVGPVFVNLNPIALGIGVGTVSLPVDMQEVESISFSYPPGPLTQQGIIVVPVKPRSQEEFMDFTGGMPTVGGGAPLEYFITSDAAGIQSIQVYPLPTVAGQLNVYYRQRALGWALNPGPPITYSSSNVDTSWQELAILWACKCVCEATNAFDKVQYFDAEYKSQLELAKFTIARRRRTKQTVVKEVWLDYSPWPGWTR